MNSIFGLKYIEFSCYPATAQTIIIPTSYGGLADQTNKSSLKCSSPTNIHKEYYTEMALKFF